MNRIVPPVVGIFVVVASLIYALYTFSPQKSMAALVDDQVAKHEFRAVLRERFASDYEAALAAVASEPMLSERQQLYQAIMIVRAIHEKYSPFAGRAPDSSLQALLVERAALLRTIKDVRGPLACAWFAMEGWPEYYSKRDRIFEQMDAVTTALLTAIADGRDNPISRRAASQEDFDVLAAALRAQGVEIEVNNNASRHPTETDCDNAIAKFEVAATVPGMSGERIRSYLVDVISSKELPTSSSE